MSEQQTLQSLVSMPWPSGTQFEVPLVLVEVPGPTHCAPKATTTWHTPEQQSAHGTLDSLSPLFGTHPELPPPELLEPLLVVELLRLPMALAPSPAAVPVAALIGLAGAW